MSHIQSLDYLRIARPCPARWEDMAGDDRVRFCQACRKNVYNLSALSQEAAAKLIEEREGELCALLYRRKDGTVLTSDCPVGARAFASRVFRRIAATLTSLLLMAGGRYLTPEFKARIEKKSMTVSPSRQELEMLKQLGSLGYID